MTNALIVLSQQTNEVVIITDAEQNILWVNEGFQIDGSLNIKSKPNEGCDVDIILPIN